jgi:hypothetical protein
MTRIFHSWDKWECYKHNFFGGVLDYEKDDTLALYASLLKDLPAFEQALIEITTTWKYSCEHNLTNESMNRIAWLGQASCALVFNVPSAVCMGGYNLLSPEEQKAADAMAEKYLNKWLEAHEHS